MISNKKYNGTFYSKLTPPDFVGLLEKILVFNFEAKKVNNTLDWKIDVFLVMNEFNGDKKFDVLKSQSRFFLTIENGVTVDELYSIINEAVDYLKAFPHCSAHDRQTLLADIPYLPLEQHQEKLNEISKAF